jgi:hypothetical protein
MKIYYAVVNVEFRWFGTSLPAENVAATFETATASFVKFGSEPVNF